MRMLRLLKNKNNTALRVKAGRRTRKRQVWELLEDQREQPTPTANNQVGHSNFPITQTL